MNEIDKKSQKKYIIGLDVSTSTVGICLFEDIGSSGILAELTHCSLIKPKGEYTPESILAIKANEVTEFIYEKYKNLNISEIIIEEPLQNSKQPNTAAMLNLFGGMVYATLYQLFKVYPQYVSIDKARRFGLPELVAGKNILFKPFPREIQGVKIKDYRKLIILSIIAKRYPQVEWLLNRNFTIDKKNCDRADSIVTVLGLKALKGEWKSEPVEIYSTIDFLQKNINYLKFINETVNNKALLPEEKKQLKKDYLTEVFNVNEFINLKY